MVFNAMGVLQAMLLPFMLYLIPALVVDRLAIWSRGAVPRLLIYSLPFAAWFASIAWRSGSGVFFGMGNYLFEPMLLAIVPILFLVSVRLKPLAESRTKQVAWLAGFSLIVLAAGRFMPPWGDWP